MDPIQCPPIPARKGVSAWAVIGMIYGASMITFMVIGTCVVFVEEFAAARVDKETNITAQEDREEPAAATPVEPPAAPSEPEANNLPSWIPVYPNVLSPARVSNQEVSGELRGTTTFETRDSADTVREFYETQFKAAGFEMTVDRKTTRQSEDAQITGSKSAGKPSIHVAIHQVKERTGVTLSYEDAER